MDLRRKINLNLTYSISNNYLTLINQVIDYRILNLFKLPLCLFKTDFVFLREFIRIEEVMDQHWNIFFQNADRDAN